MPTVGFQASDLFAAGAQFHEQTSSSPAVLDAANIMDKDGNIECETMINPRTEYTNSFDYCNATPDLATDLGELLTKFGDVHDSKKITQMVINFAAGQYASLDITGHNHDDNPHTAGATDGYVDASAAVAASAGFGVPTFTGQVWGVNATGSTATLTFSSNHVDKEDHAGLHFVGKSITFRAELTMEFEGVPTTPEATGWTVDSKGPNDANQDFDSYAITMHRHFDLAA